MKIILSPSEVKEIKKVAETIAKGSTDIDNAIGINCVTKVASLTDIFGGCKFANVQIGAQGVTINVDPRFTKDLCFLYEKYLSTTMNHMVALVKSFAQLNNVSMVVMDKWF